MRLSIAVAIASVLGSLSNAAARNLQSAVVSVVQPSSNSCIQPPPQATFVAGAGNIYEYIVIQSMQTGDVVSIHWVNPYSQAVMVTSWPRPLSNPGNYCWTGAYLAPPQYSYTPGMWTVQVYVNGQSLGQTAFTVTPTWQTMTQQQKNQAIVKAGLNGHTSILQNSALLYDSGLECKLWVQQTVATASNNAVAIPTTAPNGYQWNFSPHVVQVSSNLASAQPGWVIQFEETRSFQNTANSTGPHTAIVLSVTPLGIFLLDSNWVAKYWVGIHFMSWAQIKSDFSNYTVYQVI